MGHSGTCWLKNRHLTEALDFGGVQKQPPLGLSLLDLRAKAVAPPGWDREKEVLKSVFQGRFPGPAPSDNVDCEGKTGNTEPKEDGSEL